MASCAVLVLAVSFAGWWAADRYASANRAKAVTAAFDKFIVSRQPIRQR
jgi:hypothetical protein